MPITPYRPNWPTGTPGGPQTAGRPQGPAITLGQQQFNLGSGLLDTQVTGNGFGQVTMPQGPAMPTSQVTNLQPQLNQGPAMPTSQVAGNSFGFGATGGPQYNAPELNTSTTTNPWLRQQGRGIMNQTNMMLGQNLAGIQGSSVASGGLGGSRQGVAQGTAMGQASNYLSANLANLYGAAHENQQNRNLQQYGIDSTSANQRYSTDTNSYINQRGQDIDMRGQDLDTYNQQMDRNLQQYGVDSNRFLGQRGQDVTMRGQDLQTWNAGQDRNLQQYNSDQDFWTAQRGQDLAQIGMGAGLINQGLNTQWLPMQNAADVYSKFTGYGTQTNTSQQGGGWQGALGGALGLMNFGKDMGWYGNGNSGGSSGSGGWW